MRCEESGGAGFGVPWLRELLATGDENALLERLRVTVFKKKVRPR
jgi:hypothetical protein